MLYHLFAFREILITSRTNKVLLGDIYKISRKGKLVEIEVDQKLLGAAAKR